MTASEKGLIEAAYALQAALKTAAARARCKHCGYADTANVARTQTAVLDLARQLPAKKPRVSKSVAT